MNYYLLLQTYLTLLFNLKTKSYNNNVITDLSIILLESPCQGILKKNKKTQNNSLSIKLIGIMRNSNSCFPIRYCNISFCLKYCTKYNEIRQRCHSLPLIRQHFPNEHLFALTSQICHLRLLLIVGQCGFCIFDHKV